MHQMDQGLRRASRRALTTGVISLVSIVTLVACVRPSNPTDGLAWAYPSGAETAFGKPLGPGPFHMPGSPLTLTSAQIKEADGPIDWYPEDHPPAPDIVRGPAAGGTEPCAECHALNGGGYPASADLAGLPAAYIVEQVKAFRSGDRRSAQPGQPNTAEMIKAALSVTPKELDEAATYFASLPRTAWLRVIETETAPRTIPDKYGWLNRAPGGGTEPVGDRIVELSDDIQRAFLNDDHVTLTDYVPPGAVARGGVIAATGGGAGIPCTTCHGPELRGTEIAPPLAARPSGYIARTLWDIRVNARRGESVAEMQRSAKTLSPAEIRDVAAYLASLKP
jgi:cytochrome c553